jgi:hypothetical protein
VSDSKRDEAPSKNALLYVSRKGNGAALLTTLYELRQEMHEYKIPTGDVTCFEISQEADGIYLNSVSQVSPLPRLKLDQPEKVMQLTSNEDPRTLYLLPYMPSSSHQVDSHAEDVLRERIRSSIITLLARLDNQPREYDLDDVMNHVIPVWRLWEDKDQKKNLRKYVRQFLREFFTLLRKATEVQCEIKDGKIVCPPVSNTTAVEMRKYLRSSEVRRQNIRLSGPLQNHMDDISMPTE